MEDRRRGRDTKTIEEDEGKMFCLHTSTLFSVLPLCLMMTLHLISVLFQKDGIKPIRDVLLDDTMDDWLTLSD